MKAKDLRVGNWVNYPKIDKPIQITGVYLSTPNEIASFVTSYGRTIPFTDIEPILLTEKILLKCGFDMGNCDSTGCDFSKDEFDITMYVDDEKSGGYLAYKKEVQEDKLFQPITHWLAEFQYLNQLQNLYYALTGTELTVNL